jgi:hypothetical protein
VHSVFSYNIKICALILLIGIGAGGCSNEQPSTAKATVTQSPRPDFRLLASSYGIEIQVVDQDFSLHKGDWNVAGAAPLDDSVKAYAKLFEEEFSLYPAELVRRVGLRRVILCGNLFCNGSRRAAVPDYEHDLYIDVTGRGGHNLYKRETLHHEFFHMVDFADDGLLVEDERWNSLNPRGFRYGAGGKSAQRNLRTGWLSDDYPGFLNHYSTTAIEEDKAEVFANLIVESGYMESRAMRDPVIRAKICRIKEFVVAFCPEADERFWERATIFKRPFD